LERIGKDEQMEYHRLGDYIREVNVRNRELKVTNLLGLSIEKRFIPSIANTIGTDMSVYKIVMPKQFSYVPVTSRNGDKITVALYEGEESAIISQAYIVFEIIDHNALLPEYLMMWFRRPEFDRYARFHSHGSAREVFDWDELCEVRLPIPSIVRQREIVTEYETLSNRIRLNEQMIEKLEATAQALYRKMFVDGVDMENLPEGWRRGKLGDICDTQYGYTETATTEVVGPKFLRITDIVNDIINWSKVPYCPISESDFKKYKLELGDIVVSRTGANIGWAKQIKGVIPNSVFASFLIRIKVKYPTLQWLVGYLVESLDFKVFVEANQQGSAQPQANANVLVKFPLLIPDEQSLKEYNTHILPINQNICLIEQENSKLTELQSLLLARMGK
jgi:type I restriction enzyme S subunit